MQRKLLEVIQKAEHTADTLNLKETRFRVKRYLSFGVKFSEEVSR